MTGGLNLHVMFNSTHNLDTFSRNSVVLKKLKRFEQKTVNLLTLLSFTTAEKGILESPVCVGWMDESGLSSAFNHSWSYHRLQVGGVYRCMRGELIWS